MDFFSLAFATFLAILWIAYYTVAKHKQWICLLLGSMVFYLLAGGGGLLFLLFSSGIVYAGALALDKREAAFAAYKKAGVWKTLSSEEKKAGKKRHKQGSLRILYLSLFLIFGVLAALKYLHLLQLVGAGFLLPLGISFYTFQSAGYLIDVYGGKIQVEKNYFRLLLFLGYFPQLIQGPINRYDAMAEQLFAEEPRKVDKERCKRALLLILFGLMKKYAIADLLSSSVSAVLDGELSHMPGSLIVYGILLYSFWQYADFSGGIDIVLGVSELFGISMMPNFRQPYFAVSLGDFWRRWHISLGAWMRDYVFYPFALTKPMQNLGKKITRLGGKDRPERAARLWKHLGRTLPAGIANLLVFFLVGLWHGAELHYILWGIYNGLVIALSDLTEPVWKGLGALISRVVRIPDGLAKALRILRTFIIVNIGWYFDRIYDFGGELLALRYTFTRFLPEQFVWALKLDVLNPDKGKVAYTLGGYVLAFAGLMLVLADSVLRERGKDPVQVLKNHRILLGIPVILLMLFLVLGSFMFANGAGGFLYAGF